MYRAYYQIVYALNVPIPEPHVKAAEKTLDEVRELAEAGGVSKEWTEMTLQSYTLTLRKVRDVAMNMNWLLRP